MDKESIIGLQKIDCNCNDCWYMVRDIARFEYHKQLSKEYAFIAFEAAKKRKIEAAKYWEERGEYVKATALVKESDKIKIENYNPQQLIQYGTCHKFNKPVSFIPNVCQLDTQECFEHRRS